MRKSKIIQTQAASPAIHPGIYVRESILTPKKVSVSAAAKLVGVGRPALSNFLNGHVSATTDMASRIEVAFSLPAQQLLDMQASFDAAEVRTKGTPANAIPYVVPFLGIKAAEIESWISRNIVGRTRLAVFLRTLVNSTGAEISKIDFPGNDDAERPGWDGEINTTRATPWIPAGHSGWEFGTNEDVKTKADGDFKKSVKAYDKAIRDETTFVFVTPRHWAGKSKWVKEAQAKGHWKEVRAYDSSDLEQWLEQSIPAQTWFANETDRFSNGVMSLDKCWSEWAKVTNPPLVGTLFKSSVETTKGKMLSWLVNPPNEPTVIAADSVEEALAFLSQLFGPEGGAELESYRDRVLVFDKIGVLPKLAQGNESFIAVAANRDVEREFGPLVRSMHSIAIYPRNATSLNPDMVLDPPNYEVFRSSLEEMGYSRDETTKYSNESGRSPTVLRRRLATVPAVQTPAWAVDAKTTEHLVPFLFVGAWSSSNPADQSVLVRLANTDSYDKLEKEFQRFAVLNDPPVWSVDSFRGVTSKIDLLFAIASAITTKDLERYFQLAEDVLGEDDPLLDLPEDKRWTASWSGKSRQYSPALRKGVSETLVLLAIHGNNLFRTRIGFDCEIKVRSLVRKLLTPMETRVLEANDRDLPAYAEAAPDEFLKILEEDLRAETPACYGLMRPAGTGVFNDGCARTGLLWALEGLAWNPITLPRVSLILAQLAGIEINDNWVNKPIHSLGAIFCAWMPQTTRDHDARVSVMKLLADKWPEIAWRICISQINTGPKTGDYSHKPKWRNDGNGLGEPFKTMGPIWAFVREMVDMALNWKNGYSRDKLCDLIQHLHDLSEEHQEKVWTLVKSWAESEASDSDKAFVREKIRVTVMSRRGTRRAKSGDFAKLSAAATASYKALEPADLLSKHQWLFREGWVEESADELHEDEMDFSKRDERILKLRISALREILDSRGLAGIFEFVEIGKANSQIGWILITELLNADTFSDFFLAAMQPEEDTQSWGRKSLVEGALGGIADEEKRVKTLRQVQEKLAKDTFVRLLLLAPFRRSVWQIVDTLDEVCRETYWREVYPAWIHNQPDESKEAVERLLASQRPRAAFACAHYKLDSIGPELLFRLMSEMAAGGKDQAGQFQLEEYYVDKAFALIDKSTALTLEQKAGLEFAYVSVIAKSWSRDKGYGIPNLEKYIETHPELFAQAVTWTYRRSGEGEDPVEWKVDSGQVEHFAERGYKLLDGLTRIPGHDPLGDLKTERLAAWIKKVRDQCKELGRLDVADISLGKLLSNAPLGKDGVWPCEPVRQVMEDLRSKSIMEGAYTGLYNSRGVIWRGEGGGQERELAAKYRAWANALQYSHPFVASHLMMEMTNTYEHEASREDAQAAIRRRLH